jgi:ATP-dependent protease ClpP protease subunit
MGMAANMVAVLLQMGQKRLITPNTFIMIHEVSQIAVGKLSEIIDAAKFGSRIQERLRSILADRSTLSVPQIKTRWSRKDWSLDAGEAVKLGFADGIVETNHLGGRS